MYKKLFKVKQQIGKLSKNATNPFFKSKYLDLNDLLTAVEEVLIEYDILLLQPIEGNKVRTELIDIETNDKVYSECEIPTTNDPQKLGSSITYLRRYTLVSLLSLQAIDDDANMASNPSKQPEKWLNDKEFNAIKKRVEEGNIPSMEKIKLNFKVSREMENKLINMGIV